MPNNTLLEVKDLKMYFENTTGRNDRTCGRVRMWEIYNRIFDHASV